MAERERERNWIYEFYQNLLDFEAKAAEERKKGKVFFKFKDIKPQWNGHGYAYYIVDPSLGSATKLLTFFIEEIPPMKSNVEHKHMSEAIVHFLKGHGHIYIGGTRDDERATTHGTRYEWEAGDTVAVPANTWHVFFNDDPNEWARFAGFTTNLLRLIGLEAFHHHHGEGRSPIDTRFL